jgi:hypothetical protein
MERIQDTGSVQGREKIWEKAGVAPGGADLLAFIKKPELPGGSVRNRK